MKDRINQRSVLMLQSILLALSALLFAISFIFYLRIQSADTSVSQNADAALSSEAEAIREYSSASYSYEYSPTLPILSQAPAELEAVASPDHLYTILWKDGAICVFLREEEEAILKLYPDFESMPQEDLKLLSRGIYADSASQLIRILQDYDG